MDLLKAKDESIALIVSPDEDQQDTKLSSLIGNNEQISAGLMGHEKVNFEDFQSGSHKDEYSYVVFACLDSKCSEDDIAEKEDMYTYYGAAPVCAWVVPREMDRDLERAYSYSTSEIFLASHKRFAYKENDESTKASAMLQAMAWAKSVHQAKLKDDVKKAFNNFDTNASGTIDKSELADLSKTLGHELSEEQLDSALKDLDLNEDGVIDLDEFSRWYFTGMKCYGQHKRTMLQLGKSSTSIFNKLAS